MDNIRKTSAEIVIAWYRRTPL